jgi:hypothetical protein
MPMNWLTRLSYDAPMAHAAGQPFTMLADSAGALGRLMGINGGALGKYERAGDVIGAARQGAQTTLPHERSHWLWERTRGALGADQWAAAKDWFANLQKTGDPLLTKVRKLYPDLKQGGDLLDEVLAWAVEGGRRFESPALQQLARQARDYPADLLKRAPGAALTKPLLGVDAARHGANRWDE